MERKAIYSIEYIESIFKPLVMENLNVKNKKVIKFTIDGEQIHALSARYKLFFTHECTCVRCGLKASFYALERSKGAKRYHLNLYGYRDSKQVLFTKDHVLPHSRGGKDELSNYQVMCTECNAKKGNRTEEEVALGLTAGGIKIEKLKYNKQLFFHKVQSKKERMVIQHNGKFINFHWNKNEVIYVDELLLAKKYDADLVEKYLQKAFSLNLLSDKNINNYTVYSDRKLKKEFKTKLDKLDN